MGLDAQQVAALQNNQPPTDWSQFDQQMGNKSSGDANRFAQDGRLHVRFFTKPRLNPDKSQEANRPIYEDTVYIEIMMPGEKNNIIVRPTRDGDFSRFHQQYALFKQGIADQVVGTPLKVLPFLTESQVEELAWFKIRTVEQLADLSDNAQFMGAVELKNKAKRFLDLSRSNETLHSELQTQKHAAEESERRLKELEETARKQHALIEKLMAEREGDAQDGGKTPEHIARSKEAPEQKRR